MHVIDSSIIIQYLIIYVHGLIWVTWVVYTKKKRDLELDILLQLILLQLFKFEDDLGMEWADPFLLKLCWTFSAWFKLQFYVKSMFQTSKFIKVIMNCSVPEVCSLKLELNRI